MWRFPGIRSTACSLLFFCLPGTENRMFFAAADVVKVLKYKLPMWWRCSTTSFRRGEGAQLQASCRYGWYFCGLRSVRQKKKKSRAVQCFFSRSYCHMYHSHLCPVRQAGQQQKGGTRSSWLWFVSHDSSSQLWVFTATSDYLHTLPTPLISL